MAKIKVVHSFISKSTKSLYVVDDKGRLWLRFGPEEFEIVELPDEPNETDNA